MRTVEDGAGRRYLLVKRSGESSLVRDLRTGAERYVANDRLADLDGVDPLAAAAAAVPPGARDRLRSVRGDGALGLLVLLAREPRTVRSLLRATDRCESDLLGISSELRAAGLIEDASVGGEPGYAATEAALDLLDGPQSADAPSSETSD